MKERKKNLDIWDARAHLSVCTPVFVSASILRDPGRHNFLNETVFVEFYILKEMHLQVR